MIDNDRFFQIILEVWLLELSRSVMMRFHFYVICGCHVSLEGIKQALSSSAKPSTELCFHLIVSSKEMSKWEKADLHSVAF